MRTAGRLVAAFVTGVIVFSGVKLLDVFDFAPVKYLTELDERLYLSLSNPPPALPVDARPVLFLDVNDESVRDDSGGHASRTPREILAFLVRWAKRSEAAVIFLDIDLRDPTSDAADAALDEALKADGPPVLVPQFFRSRTFPVCGQPLDSKLVGASLMDLAIGRDAPTVRVHALFEPGVTGTANGFCSAYTFRDDRSGGRNSIMAAMEAAVLIARGDPCWKVGQPSCPAPEEKPIAWYIPDEPRPPKSGAAFARVPAIFLKPPQQGWSAEARVPPHILPVSKGAIVIVGASHQSSDDKIRTPLGYMPGALVHANAAVSLQTVHPGELGRLWPELLFLFAAPAATAFVCRRRIYRNLGKRRRLSPRHKLHEVWIELAISLAIWGGFCAVVLLATERSDSWRFGIIGGLVSIGIVCLSSVTQIAGDQSHDWGARLWRKASRGPGIAPSSGSDGKSP